MSIRGGIRLVDTAEVYGSGRSSDFVGEFIRDLGSPVFVATKFFPWPWRLTRRSVIRALRASLRASWTRDVDLYQIHNPYSLLSIEAAGRGARGVRRGRPGSGCWRLELRRGRDAEGILHTGAAQNPAWQAIRSTTACCNGTVERNGLLARCRNWVFA